ncbi:uncharacterized protein LOC106089665 [Stomoxys calcitrans]|uniref:uncharacterized protein LOC106089665 n=1 Tax=Stomoxys calcitrans TaxID=35570 RepID=UPI0027E28CAA|nr:uncharacterized protein LOC106089665 [Stomoxys calcitrans]
MACFQNDLNDFFKLDEKGDATICSSRSTPGRSTPGRSTPGRSTPSRSIAFTGRSRARRLGYISQRSVVGYNGHYEGDISMLGKKSLLALDTSNVEKSDNNIYYDAEIDAHKTNLNANECPRMEDKSARTLLPESQFWNLMTAYMPRFLPPQMMEKFTKFTDLVYGSPLNGFLCKICNLIRIIIVWIFHLLAVIGAKIGGVSLWIFRIHYACRRLLWSMTLTKYEDSLLFLLFLLCSPLVFSLAAVGFVLSLYASLKELLEDATARLRAAA